MLRVEVPPDGKTAAGEGRQLEPSHATPCAPGAEARARQGLGAASQMVRLCRRGNGGGIACGRSVCPVKVVSKQRLQCGSSKGKTLRNKTTAPHLKTEKYDCNDVMSPVHLAVHLIRNVCYL